MPRPRLKIGRGFRSPRNWSRTSPVLRTTRTIWPRRTTARERSSWTWADALAQTQCSPPTKPASAALLYNLACVHALAAAVQNTSPLRLEYASRAVRLLHQVKEVNFFTDKAKIELLRKDPDLDSLRGRAD